MTFLAINPAWISAGMSGFVLVGVPLLIGIYKQGRAVFLRLDHQDTKLEANNKVAVVGLANVATQISDLAFAQKEANGKVGKLQTDVAMLQGTVYGKDATQMGGKQ